ncbi:MAG TPA: HIT family protein [Nocardioidaceae bacterium]|nr:HIT family protein [Nocardioidaceae bacterium]
MADCVFCNVISGTVTAPIVHQTADTVAFLDHRPVFKGHTLVVPRDHIVTLPDLPTGLLTPLFAETQRIADAITSGLGAQGTFVAVNNVVSQSVAHLHVHVVPRTKGDGLRGFFWPRVKYADGEPQEYARRIADAVVEG